MPSSSDSDKTRPNLKQLLQTFKFPIIATILAILPFIFMLMPCPPNFKKHQLTCQFNYCAGGCSGGGCRYMPETRLFACVCLPGQTGVNCEECKDGHEKIDGVCAKICGKGLEINGKCVCDDGYSGEFCNIEKKKGLWKGFRK